MKIEEFEKLNKDKKLKILFRLLDERDESESNPVKVLTTIIEKLKVMKIK